MKKTFIQNLVLLVGLNLLVKPFYLLFVETEIQNRTGQEVFGLYFALINFSFIINIIPDLGMTNWNTRRTSKNGFSGKAAFFRLMKIRLMLAAIYLLTALTIGVFLQYEMEQLWFLMILSFNQILVSAILYIRSFLTGMHLFRRDSIVSVLDRIILLAMMSYCLWGIGAEKSFKIEWLIYGQTISYAITLMVAVAFIFSGAKKENHNTDEDLSAILILKESFPFALLIMLSMIGYRADSVMLERISGSEEAGIYAMAFRFFEAVNMISYLFAVLLLPMFTKQLAEKISIAPLLHLSFKILYAGLIVLAVVCTCYNQEILSLFYDSKTENAASVFSWLIISAVFFSLQYISGTLITASGKMKPMIWIALGGMIYNVFLNLIYIPQEGAAGAAKASCFTQLVIFVAQLIVVVRRHDTGNIKSLAIRAIIFTMLSFSIAIFFKQESVKLMFGMWGWMLLIALLCTSAIITGMLNMRSWTTFIPALSGSRTSLNLQNQDKQKV